MSGILFSYASIIFLDFYLLKLSTSPGALTSTGRRKIQQEQSESTDLHIAKSTHYPRIAQIPDLASQHGDSDHLKILISFPCIIAELS